MNNHPALSVKFRAFIYNNIIIASVFVCVVMMCSPVTVVIKL